MSFYMWKPYVPVAARRAQAAKKTAKLEKSGRKLAPVRIEGRTIAKTFWGKAWCDHIESFSDYENRLPRGRTYARNGSILDLQITKGAISALVMGSELYELNFTINPLEKSRWAAIKSRSTGQIDSLVELLQGRFSDAVMRVITARENGLFPTPKEIKKTCSCPDWAGLCKHLAAALYGIGARLDEKPDLLFLLRGVDHAELLDGAPVGTGVSGSSTLDSADLVDVFGIEIAGPDAPKQTAKPKPKARRIGKPGKKPAEKKPLSKPSAAKPPVKKVVRPAKAKPARGRPATRNKQTSKIRVQEKGKKPAR